MDILKSIFGINSAPPEAAAPATPTPTLPADYQAYLANALKAANANISAQAPLSGRGLLNLLTGRDRTAAVANVEAAAPNAYQDFVKNQTAAQTGQLGLMQTLMLMNRLNPGMGKIDPNNIPGSFAAAQGASAAPPASGAASTGQAAAPAAANPLQDQRALYGRLGAAMAGLPAYLPQAIEVAKLAQTGAPENSVVTNADGVVRDGVSGLPISGDVGDFKAGQAGKVALAETLPRVAGQKSVASYQAGLDRGTHAINADVDSQHAIKTGIDAQTGLPVTTTDYDLIHGGKETFAADNPFFAGQQAELKDMRTKAESAEQGLGLATQISNAANGLYTGKGSSSFQELRKIAQAAGQLTGNKLDPRIDNDTSKFEQLKFAAQQLVAVASHELSPRVAMNIYNQIAAVKPGEQTSIKGLRDIINNNIVPVLARSKALYQGATNYYRSNPFKNDAMAVLPDTMPLQNFGVKSVQDAKPGDYFIDPRDGALKQRPH